MNNNNTIIINDYSSSSSSSSSSLDIGIIDEIIEQNLFDQNNFEMEKNDCVFRPTIENYLMILTFAIIFCLSVVGNSIVVVVILQQQSMRSVTNLYLLNLALSDLLLSMPPTLVSSLVYCWVFGDLLCKLLAYLQPVVVTASAYTLAAIALERYYAICKPLHSRIWHTRTHAMLVSVIANVFMLFMYEERSYNFNGLNCAPKFEPIVHFGYQIYMTIALLIVPLVTMTVLYGNVIYTLSSGIRMDIAAIAGTESNNNSTPLINSNNSCAEKRKKFRNGFVNNFTIDSREELNRGRLSSWMLKKKELNQKNILNQQKSLNSVRNWNECSIKKVINNSTTELRSTHSGRTALAKQRLIRMLIVIVVIFFCCWTPSYIWWLLLNAQDTFQTFNIWNSEVNTFITVLTYLSSCTNPITYCFLNNKFRNALCLTFGFSSNINKDRASRIQRTQTSAAGTPRDDFHSCLSDTKNSNASAIPSDAASKIEEEFSEKSNKLFQLFWRTNRSILGKVGIISKINKEDDLLKNEQLNNQNNYLEKQEKIISIGLNRLDFRPNFNFNSLTTNLCKEI
ncbi:G_PROTEIN_RECEP_F1_2 domain-containing protein [Meloidogyne graminicola]|uniref:G_PROTEIN_RECEP_F1_2 domain-containing protein n=1 Tax=Meloidogyne graminicola TaxID=189291 RepID=A0A8S9ZIH0_9BILA|nr:G_PROTEIN_RECEP_F1_2 domain-containing protein [Meloidogyne graminicola]